MVQLESRRVDTFSPSSGWTNSARVGSAWFISNCVEATRSAWYRHRVESIWVALPRVGSSIFDKPLFGLVRVGLTCKAFHILIVLKISKKLSKKYPVITSVTIVISINSCYSFLIKCNKNLVAFMCLNCTARHENGIYLYNPFTIVFKLMANTAGVILLQIYTSSTFLRFKKKCETVHISKALNINSGITPALWYHYPELQQYKK